MLTEPVLRSPQGIILHIEKNQGYSYILEDYHFTQFNDRIPINRNCSFSVGNCQCGWGWDPTSLGLHSCCALFDNFAGLLLRPQV